MVNGMTAAGGRDGRLCPSAPCEDGAILLGLVGSAGTVAYITPQVRIGDRFLQKVGEGRSAERRFRFAQPCREAGCAQWTGDRCAIIDAAVSRTAVEPAGPTSALPACSIRRWCRWFSQAGRDACCACPRIVTDTRPEPAGETSTKPSR
jgi:hypothetical protein